MLLVIFGAGASYDSFADEPPAHRENDFRPPLASQLFSNRGFFRSTLQAFPECQALVTRLSSPQRSIEEELARIQAEAEGNPDRDKQLAAIRFYLRKIIGQVETQWSQVHRGVTNYKTLLDDLKQWHLETNEEVCLVTFNYDKMLEAAMPEVGINCGSLSDYISNKNWKLVKLHGSVDWVHPISPVLIDSRGHFNQLEIMKQMIADTRALQISKEIELVSSPDIFFRLLNNQAALMLFPAIAIPVTTKTQFECPQSHLDALCASVPKISSILAIGWGGAEQHFLNLLKTSGLRPEQIHLIVVDSDQNTAADIGNKLKSEGICKALSATEGGFSLSLRNDQIRHYLSASKEYLKLAT